MKKLLALIASLVLVLMIATAHAEVSSAAIVGVYPNESAGTMAVYFQMREDTGSYVSPENDAAFSLNNAPLHVSGSVSNSEGVTYIFVVDCSMYYQGTRTETVQQILNGVIGGMRVQDRATFVILNASTATSIGEFMDRDSALSWVMQIQWLENNNQATRESISAPLWKGLDMALRIANVSRSDIPTQKVVVVVTDAVSDEANESGYTAESVTNSLNGNIPVFCVVPFNNTTSTSAIRDLAQQGREKLALISGGTSGSFYAIDETSLLLSNDIQSAVNQIVQYVNGIYQATVSLVGVSEPGSGESTLRVSSVQRQSVSAMQQVSLNWDRIPTPTPAPVLAVSTPNPVKYTWDETGADIYNIQRRLKELYYYQSSDFSLVFDKETKRAIMDFCRANGLTEYNEGIGTEAYERLMSGSAVAMTTATPVPEITRDPDKVLEEGQFADRGVICSVQDHLQALYYWEFSEASYGVLDNTTQHAINLFCMDNGLSTGSGMSVKAYELLMNGDPKPRETETPEPMTTRDPGMVLIWGADDNDASVICQVQDKLEALGYWSREKGDYGFFDQETLAAINRFCDVNGQGRSNGLNQAAYAAIMSDDALAKDAEEAIADLEPGNAGDQVTRYQNRLMELGYLADGSFKPGVFDEATQAAQDRLCEVNGYKPEAGASAGLRELVYSGLVKSNEKVDWLEQAKAFALGTTELFGLAIPTWALLAAGLAVIVAVLVVVIVLVCSKSKKKKRKADPSAVTAGVAAGTAGTGGAAFDDDETGVAFSDEETQPDGFNSEETQVMEESGADLPTSIDMNVWNINVRIDFNGASEDRVYRLEENIPVVVGRGTDATIQLGKEDMRASRHHGQLCYRNGEVYYKDSSKMGTVVDGIMIHESETVLHNGSILNISSHRLVIQMI